MIVKILYTYGETEPYQAQEYHRDFEVGSYVLEQ